MGRGKVRQFGELNTRENFLRDNVLSEKARVNFGKIGIQKVAMKKLRLIQKITLEKVG